jgi:hypothetical protein
MDIEIFVGSDLRDFIFRWRKASKNAFPTLQSWINRQAKEEQFWISETPDDRHLQVYFGVVMEPAGNPINRFHVMTSVFFKHWTGPVYFNIIRPFRHLVVSRMARYGLTRNADTI